MMIFNETAAERIHRETEREIFRMKAKIARFQKKLRHLQDVYALTMPEGKQLVEQMDMFGT